MWTCQWYDEGVLCAIGAAALVWWTAGVWVRLIQPRLKGRR